MICDDSGPVEKLELGPVFSPEAGNWIVLHTKSRQEKALAQDLSALRIHHFLPLIQLVRIQGGRRFTVEAPLFPGYVFIRGQLDDAYAADRTRRIANILRVPDQDELSWELRNLALALSKEGELNPYPYLRAGVRVEVKSGPLRGLQGYVDSATGRKQHIVLTVHFLGRSTALDIHGALLELA